MTIGPDERLILEFQYYLVGTIRDVFVSDQVWHGVFEVCPVDSCSLIVRRVVDFISFCKKWNEDARTGDGADASLFATYHDLIGTGNWTARAMKSRRRLVIEDAPVFFEGGDISFREVRQCHSQR